VIAVKQSGRQVEKHSDFSEEYSGREVVIVLHNNHVVNGKIVEVRRFWIKALLSDGRMHYINKAWIVYIEPKK